MQNKICYQPIFLKYNICSWSSNKSHGRNYKWGSHTPYTGSLIIRGIGYRAFAVSNDMLSFRPSNSQSLTDLKTSWHNFCAFENPFLRYFIIRAGHTKDLYHALHNDVYVKTLKKDRKLTIYGEKKQKIFYLIRGVTQYRKPSVYTGRGVRVKHLDVLKKAGKKDKQKGKSF